MGSRERILLLVMLAYAVLVWGAVIAALIEGL